MFLLVFKAEMESVLKNILCCSLVFSCVDIVSGRDWCYSKLLAIRPITIQESLFEVHLALFIQLILLLTVFIYICYIVSLERNSLFYGLP